MSILLTHTLRHPITLSGLNPAARPPQTDINPKNHHKILRKSLLKPEKTPKTTPKSVKIPPSNLTISSKTLEILSDQARGKKFRADNLFGRVSTKSNRIEQGRTRWTPIPCKTLGIPPPSAKNTDHPNTDRRRPHTEQELSSCRPFPSPLFSST